ncbi:DUF3833 domain-containing protein [Arcobacter sp. YIC-464]|uniref:DUF3833 domain-containing protein n=1 Tax=Arcobacter sp. YIC-464 TaxID=3376631 RepID=UPI003C1C255F
MKTKNLLVVLFIALLFTGCGSMKLEDFNNKTPKFIVKEYFNGELKAYGLVKDRSGKIIKSFKAKMIGSWDDDGVGTLDEYFVYDDGEKQRRVWTLIPTKNENEYIGTASDIVGQGILKSNGNTVMIDYTMEVPYNNSIINIDVKDWLHLQEDGVIINHSKMKKFGFTVGELVITIIKQ